MRTFVWHTAGTADTFGNKVSCCADGSRPSRSAAKRHENIAPCSTCIRNPLPLSSGAARRTAKPISLFHEIRAKVAERKTTIS